MMGDTGASGGLVQLALNSAILCKPDRGGTRRTKQAAWRKAHRLQKTQGVSSDLGCCVYACMSM